VIRAPLLAAVAAAATFAGCTGNEASAPAQAAPAPLHPLRIDGHPNLNGVWQALGTANWNLEAAPRKRSRPRGSSGLVRGAAGASVVEGGTIPYLPAALEQRKKNQRAGRRPIPRRSATVRASTLHLSSIPLQIVQGDGDIMFVYEYATSNRPVRMSNHLNPDEVLVEQWSGWSNGHWDGDTLVVDVFGQISDTWFDRAGNFHGPGMKVTERYTPIGADHLQYEATIDDPTTFERPWKISMPLYRRVEPNAEIYEYKCVEFAEPLLYGELLKDPIK
jgi:hypothetical protein